MQPQILYQLALVLIPGIGPVKAKTLIKYCGSAESVLREKASALARIPDIGKSTISLIHQKSALLRAEKELRFIEENNIQTLYYQDNNYPERLQQCDDSPVILFVKGNMNLNNSKVISIVGTRAATAYGRGFCKDLISGIAEYSPLVVSGLAYGIDICAHRNALDYGLSTAACVAHGLDKIYPAGHASVASQMLQRGGLISEIPSETRMMPEFFPMRNRIIAGLSDCTIVVETDERGGSMITAHLANSYSREVYALPGRNTDKHSTGCNLLIKKNIAAILTRPGDLVEYLNWDKKEKTRETQLPLFPDLSPDETAIVNVLTKSGKTGIDELCLESGIAFSRLSNLLLNMEFRGLVISCPGKSYDLTTS